jgi:hypothetical protein
MRRRKLAVRSPPSSLEQSGKVSPMPRVTLDTNAIIDLEEDRPGAQPLRELIALHRARQITICVSAIAASERDRDPESGDPSFARFTEKLARADLADAEELAPPLYFDLTFWDHCVWGELNDPLLPDITDILYPDGLLSHERVLPAETEDQRRTREKGTNQLCDVLTMWCHIHYRGHVFVTRDERFHRAGKKPRLIQLGAGYILKPEDALQLLRSGHGPRP